MFGGAQTNAFDRNYVIRMTNVVDSDIVCRKSSTSVILLWSWSVRTVLYVILILKLWLLSFDDIYVSIVVITVTLYLTFIFERNRTRKWNPIWNNDVLWVTLARLQRDIYVISPHRTVNVSYPYLFVNLWSNIIECICRLETISIKLCMLCDNLYLYDMNLLGFMKLYQSAVRNLYVNKWITQSSPKAPSGAYKK